MKNNQTALKKALLDLLNGNIDSREFSKICKTPLSPLARKNKDGKIVYQSLIGERTVSEDKFAAILSEVYSDSDEYPVIIIDDVREN
jgi:hypothetical protein